MGGGDKRGGRGCLVVVAADSLDLDVQGSERPGVNGRYQNKEELTVTDPF